MREALPVGDELLRTIIAGSRTLKSPSLVAEAVALSGFEVSTVISGAQRSWDPSKRLRHGADYFGELWAAEHSIPVERFPARWKVYGRRAGPIRNQIMVENSQALILIWDGKSRGSRHILGCMEIRKRPIFEIEVELD